MAVGVISPYSCQVELIQQMTERAGLKGCAKDSENVKAEACGALIEVRTVDGFQVLRGFQCSQ